MIETLLSTVAAIVFWILYGVSKSDKYIEYIRCDVCGADMHEWTPPLEFVKSALKNIGSLGLSIVAGGGGGGGFESPVTKMKCPMCGYKRDHIYLPDEVTNLNRKRRRAPLLIVSLIATSAVVYFGLVRRQFLTILHYLGL